jgi:hypothetical protein
MSLGQCIVGVVASMGLLHGGAAGAAEVVLYARDLVVLEQLARARAATAVPSGAVLIHRARPDGRPQGLDPRGQDANRRPAAAAAPRGSTGSPAARPATR